VKYVGTLKQMSTKALIDGDIIAYRFAFINEFDIDFGDEGEPSIITVARAEEAMVDVDHFIKWVVETTGADKAVVCLSGKDNFRYKVMPNYKDNRNASTVPTLVDVLKNYMYQAWDAKSEPQLEADDLLSILQDNKSIICTIDKDLNQVQGMHFNWNKKDLYEIDEIQASHFFWTQVLMGDSTDGYKGCPKIGKVKSKSIVDDFIERQLSEPEIWEEVVNIYYTNYRKYVDEEATDQFIEELALANARVARMVQRGEYNFETQELTLWSPEGGLINNKL